MGIVRPSDLGVPGALVATIMPHGQLGGDQHLARRWIPRASPAR
jgi:hypothetical protein